MNQFIYRAKAYSGEWVEGCLIRNKRLYGCSNEWRIKDVDTGIESDIYPDTIEIWTGLTIDGEKLFTGQMIEVPQCRKPLQVYYCKRTMCFSVKNDRLDLMLYQFKDEITIL